jgi:hypothetical protein
MRLVVPQGELVHRRWAHSTIGERVSNPPSILQMNDLGPLHIIQIDDEIELRASTAFGRDSRRTSDVVVCRI